MASQATHKHLFYMEMAKLLEAGFGIREAAKVLLDTKLPPVQANLLGDLKRGLEAGHTIAEAFAQDRKAVSELERSILSAGERSGKLAPAFQHLADYFGMLASVRREMMLAMAYPLIVLHLGIFIGVVPTAMMKGDKSFVEILVQFGITLVAFYAIVGIAIFLLAGVFRAAASNPALDQLLNRIPFLGKARSNMAMARFCKVYHSCLLAGIPMTETVAVSSSASHSAVLRQAGKTLEQDAKTGNALGPRFIAQSAFPKTFARSYMTGEEAGTLDKDLARWASLYQTEAEASSKLLAAVVPKVLYFFILGFVAWKIISFFNGYYGRMLEMLDQ
jgi:type II secretory pathway component PulF